VLTLDGRSTWRPDRVPSGRVLVDGKGVGEVEDIVLRDRKHLSSDGIVLAVLAVAQSGELVLEPQLLSRGVVAEEAIARVHEAALSEVRAALDELGPEARTDANEVASEVRRALRRHFRRLQRRPVVLPLVLEM